MIALAGDTTCNDGVTVPGVYVSPTEWEKMTQTYQQTHNATQAISGVTTTTGENLTTAMNNYSQQVAQNGGPISPNVAFAMTALYEAVQSALENPNIVTNNPTPLNMRTGIGAGNPNSKWLWIVAILGIILLFFLFK